MATRRSTSGGFTFLELILVVVIVYLLLTTIATAIWRAKESGASIKAMSQLQALGKGIQLYSEEADRNLPPAANYGVAESDSSRLWPPLVQPYIEKEALFIAPDSNGRYAGTWNDRSFATVGMTQQAAVDGEHGCENKDTSTNCTAYKGSIALEAVSAPAETPFLATTFGGRAENGYLGFEFNPLRGLSDVQQPSKSPPLVSDSDFLKDLGLSQVEPLAPIDARYASDHLGNGVAPVLFMDGHANRFSANKLSEPGRFTWRLRGY